MREFTKVMYVVVIMICGVWTALAWGDNHPSSLTNALRYILPAVCGLSLLGFLAIHFQRDLVPDYLYQVSGNYFDRDGFCFAIDTIEQNGVCYVRAHFQNRRDTPCIGRIALRPSKDFISTAKISALAFAIDCSPAAFGISMVPLPLAAIYQGKKQRFDVGAAVEHPNGKGRTLRFRNCKLLRKDFEFKDKLATGLIVGGALTFGVMPLVSGLVWSRPAIARVTLPKNVAESLPAGAQPATATLWRLGDPEVSVADLLSPRRS